MDGEIKHLGRFAIELMVGDASMSCAGVYLNRSCVCYRMCRRTPTLGERLGQVRPDFCRVPSTYIATRCSINQYIHNQMIHAPHHRPKSLLRLHGRLVIPFDDGMNAGKIVAHDPQRALWNRQPLPQAQRASRPSRERESHANFSTHPRTSQ